MYVSKQVLEMAAYHLKDCGNATLKDFGDNLLREIKGSKHKVTIRTVPKPNKKGN
jgi:hypothetical protein